jgi:hypothetical protein
MQGCAQLFADTEFAISRPVRLRRLTHQSVADIVKTHAERVGLDPALLAGHSLPAGFLTSSAERGAGRLVHRSLLHIRRGIVSQAHLTFSHDKVLRLPTWLRAMVAQIPAQKSAFV